MGVIEDRDYYTLLGISPRATQGEIKQAYRTLARKFHPDLGHSEEYEEQFRQVTEAFKILSDPEKRNEYNKENGFEYAKTADIDREEKLKQATKEKDKHVSVAAALDPEKTWRNLGKSAEGDLKLGHKVALTPQEEMESTEEEGEEQVVPWGDSDKAPETPEPGQQKSIVKRLLARIGVGRNVDARTAEKARLRRELDEASQPLRHADTKHKVQRPQSAPRANASNRAVDPFRGDRVFNFQITPLECALGTSREIALSGLRDEKTTKVRIKIPQGIEDGTVLSVRRGWDEIKVHISIVEDSVVYLEGLDIIVRMPITVGEAVNGGNLEVPTVERHERVTISAGLDTHERIRVGPFGLSDESSGEKGELYIECYIVPPAGTVSDTLKAAVRMIDSRYDGPVRKDVDRKGNWQKQGEMSVLELPLTLGEALEGLELELSTPRGPAKVKVPPRWRWGERLAAGDGCFVMPYIVLPSDAGSDLKDAVKAVEQHYQTYVRDNLPRRLIRD